MYLQGNDASPTQQLARLGLQQPLRDPGAPKQSLSALRCQAASSATLTWAHMEIPYHCRY